MASKGLLGRRLFTGAGIFAGLVWGAFLFGCAHQGRQWSQLRAEHDALPLGIDRPWVEALLEERVGLEQRTVDRSSPSSWRCYTQWLLTHEERDRAHSLLLFRSRGVVPSECVLVFDGRGRLLKKSFDS